MLVQTRPQPLARAAALRVPPAVLIVVGSVLLATLSLLLPSAPTYDPWAWTIWGREIAQLDLNTVDGPSWKPLPVIVTTLTAPLGEVSPYVWLVIARAGAIAALALAFVLAARLAGPVAGIAATAGLGLMPLWLRSGGLGNSEGLLVALVLGAVLTHLHGRRGWAFALAIGAGLLRPEAWPFLALYALWLLVDDRSRLRWVAVGLVTLPVLWLGPEYWGSGNPFRASDRAQEPNADSPAFAENPAGKVVENAVELLPRPALAGAAALLLVVAVAGRTLPREDRRTAIWLAALAVAWVGLVAAMTVRGFSGSERYLIVPFALVFVLGAVGAVWAVRAVLGSRLRKLPWAATVAAGVALGAVFVASDLDRLGPTLRGIEYQADAYHDLGDAIEQAGGADRLKACGHAFTGAFFVPQVAWRLGVPIEDVDLEPEGRAVVFHVRTVAVAPGPSPPLANGRPNVLARDGAWTLTADCGGGG